MPTPTTMGMAELEDEERVEEKTDVEGESAGYWVPNMKKKQPANKLVDRQTDGRHYGRRSLAGRR